MKLKLLLENSVMRKHKTLSIKHTAFYLLLFGGVVFAVERPHGWVNDFANIISPDYKGMISSVITEVEQKTSAEISVVTVKTVVPKTIELYAVELFKKWGIGKAGKDNGVLVVVAVNDKAMRIEVGYGLEGVLPDGFCGEIIRKVLRPNFQKGEFGYGLLMAVNIIAGKIGKEYGVEISGVQSAIDRSGIELSSEAERGVPFFFILLFFLFIFGGRFLLPMLFLTGMGRRGYWGGGGFGGGGFGSGFGGFGGGLSGGGGASGGW